MTRLEKFQSLENHPWLGKAFKKLTAADHQICQEFLSRHAGKSVGEFDSLVNRMFLDIPKTKNYTLIQELLSCANSMRGAR